MTKREFLMFAIMVACICWAGVSSEAKPPAPGRTAEKEGWLSAPALLPTNSRWLKAGPITANIFGVVTK